MFDPGEGAIEPAVSEDPSIHAERVAVIENLMGYLGKGCCRAYSS